MKWKSILLAPAFIATLALTVFCSGLLTNPTHADPVNPVVACQPGQTNMVRGQVLASTATTITVQCALPGSVFGDYDFTSDGNSPLVITLNNNTSYQLFPGAPLTQQPPTVSL